MANLTGWMRSLLVMRDLPNVDGLSRLFGCVAIGLALALTTTTHVLAEGDRSEEASGTGPRCAVDIERWATALLEDLPAYANRQLVRAGAETRILAAGFPDIDFPADIARVSDISIAPEQNLPREEVARVFFSTAERSQGSSGSRSERAYRLLLTRHHSGIWFPQSLEIAKSDSLEPTDITEGALWQAIQQWRDAGCPGAQLPGG
ncbi:MAG: hypothetical protein AB4050_08015 [Synechococcus sp.]